MLKCKCGIWITDGLACIRCSAWGKLTIEEEEFIDDEEFPSNSELEEEEIILDEEEN